MTENEHSNYFAVWMWLMGLAILSVLASQLPLPHSLAMTVVYGGAVAKAVLVAIFFMHLRTERLLIVALIMVPVFLFIVLTVTLLPDFVINAPAG